jgi:hypothetical protein
MHLVEDMDEVLRIALTRHPAPIEDHSDDLFPRPVDNSGLSQESVMN